MPSPLASQRGSGQQPSPVSFRARGALGSGVGVGGTGVGVPVGSGVFVTTTGGTGVPPVEQATRNAQNAADRTLHLRLGRRKPEPIVIPQSAIRNLQSPTA